MSDGLVIAIDLGGTAIKHGVVTQDGRILEKDSVPTGDDLSFPAVAKRLASVINERKQKLDQKNISVLGVGIGVPGGLYADREVISQSPNFPEWKDVPLKEALQDQTGLHVCLENDANVAALGEYWLGAGRNYRSMCIMTLGTGVGGGIILNGNIWVGDDGMAGEVGHITIFPDRPSGLFGGQGSLEPLASASGIGRAGRQAVDEGRSPVLTKMAEEAPIGAKQVFLAAEKSDETAIQILDETGGYLGIAISAIVNVLNIHLFVLGGGASPAVKYMESRILREVRQRTFRIPAEGVVVRRAELDNDAGMFGAAWIVLKEKGMLEDD